jgi:hypothetical protein
MPSGSAGIDPVYAWIHRREYNCEVAVQLARNEADDESTLV